MLLLAVLSKVITSYYFSSVINIVLFPLCRSVTCLKVIPLFVSLSVRVLLVVLQ